MSLYTIARKNNAGAIIWSEDQKQRIKYEYVDKDKTLKEIAQEFGAQPQSIRNILRKMNIKITNKKIRNYPRNSNYFKEIDTLEKAYWLGLFFADGTVKSDTNEIAISLKDKEHIEKFQKAIEAVNHKIVERVDLRYSKPCKLYSISLRDSQLHEDLIKWGCLPQKSYVESLHLPDIDQRFMGDFIRGVFDGDGYINWSKNQNKYLIHWTGNKVLLEEIRHWCKKDNLSLCQNSRSKITYELRIYGKKDIERILIDMYANATLSTVLERKYKIVNSCLKSLGASPLNL